MSSDGEVLSMRFFFCLVEKDKFVVGVILVQDRTRSPWPAQGTDARELSGTFGNRNPSDLCVRVRVYLMFWIVIHVFLLYGKFICLVYR